MPVKKFNPLTPGTRFRVGNAFTEITKSKPEKSLLAPLKKSGGRNHTGKMTMRQKGGGHKRRYRIIDFKREMENTPATVQSIEYDPNRTAYIALVTYPNGEKKYILAPNGLTVGAEINSGKGAALARSAGTNGTLMGREGKYASVRLPSGEVRRILLTCKAVIGSTSNPDHSLQVLGKAGRKRWLGKRPRVRGVAMNPVDHPMGGGEGRASGGHPRSRTGIMAKGQKTRNNKKHSTSLIITKRKKKTRK